MLDKLFSGFVSWAKLRGSYNDDWVDRLNHIWTVVVLAIFSLFVTTSQFVGKPIHCWTPAQFKKPWIEYTKAYCWVSNTYYIPMDDRIPIDISEREDAQVHYYQWIPVILLLMALMFKIPNIMWHIFDDFSGINLDKITKLAEDTQIGCSLEDRFKKIKHIAIYMDRWLCQHRGIRGGFALRARKTASKVFFFACSRQQGTYLSGMYLLVKILYAANCIGQFFLLNSILRVDFGSYGPSVLKVLTETGTVRSSALFPRVTLCDLQVRQMQNLLRYTVQCVLPINLFNEKIFAFLWFWLVIVTIVTVANLFFWFYRVFISLKKVAFVKKYLYLSQQYEKATADKALVREFALDYLRDDGVFVLRVVGKNSTELVVTDLISVMWKMFKEKNAKSDDALLSNKLEEDST